MNHAIKHIETLAALKKVGFITPSSNTALEPITAALCATISGQFSSHYARVGVTSITLDGADVDQFNTSKMAAVAQQLNDAGLDAILWNGTSGSWTGGGFEADRTLCDAIHAATGLPASSSSLAQLEVLRHYRIERFALAVPYVDGPTRMIIDTYQREGFSVVRSAQLDETVNARIGRVPLERIRQLLRDADHPDAECIVVACTNLPATLVLEEMEAELGKPIFDSIAVTLWKALRMVGLDTPIHGWGKLLRDHPAHVQLDDLLEKLRVATGASRTTLRLDVPAYNSHVDTVTAESYGPGVAPLRTNASLNQRSLDTVKWLEKHKVNLIQEDCINAPVKPPGALMSIYGVKAQMLTPLIENGDLMGWISVHYIPGTRDWSDKDVALLDEANANVKQILQHHRWANFTSSSTGVV